MGFVIHGNVSRLLVKTLIDDQGEAVDVENIVGVPRFVQNHAQGRAPSPALLKEDSYGTHLPVLEKILEYLPGALRYVDHDLLLFFSVLVDFFSHILPGVKTNGRKGLQILEIPQWGS